MTDCAFSLRALFPLVTLFNVFALGYTEYETDLHDKVKVACSPRDGSSMYGYPIRVSAYQN